jgi:hypothetical protein
MDSLAVPELRTGLTAGAIAALVVLGMQWRRPAAPLPVAGLALAAAALASIAIDGTVPVPVAVGVAGLAAVTAAASATALGAPATAVLCLPFAWMVAVHGGLPPTTWIRGLVIVGASVGGALVAAADQRWEHDAIGPPLFMLSAVGVYLTVPDTEEAAALLGAALPLAVLGWPWRRVRLGQPGAAAATGVLCWVGAVGGQGRPASIVGALACLALLVGVPAAQSWRPARRARPLRPAEVVAVGAAHLGLVYVAARVAGLRTDVAEATAIAVVVLIGSVLVGLAVIRTTTS